MNNFNPRSIFVTFLIAAALFSSPAFLPAQEMSDPRSAAASAADAPVRPPKIALVLSGGSAFGIAHVGVIKILEASGIPIDMVLGTSMGSIVGGLYAAGYSPEEMEEIVTTQDWQTVFMDRKNSPRDGYDQEKRRRFALALGFDKDGIRLGEGLLEGQNVLSLFTELTLHLLGTRNFDDFPVPYRSVAAEVLTGDKVVFSSGSLAEAMRASMSIPAVFKPYTVEGKRLIDGGIVDNMPVDIARKMGADIVIAVESRGALSKSEAVLKSAFAIAGQTAGLFIEQNMKPSRSGADILIVPDLSGYTTASYDEAVGIVERGTLGAIARLMDIEKLAEKISQSRPLVSPESQANRKARRDPPPLSSFVVEGGSENDKLFVLGLFDPMAGQKADPVRIRAAIDAAYSSGRFDLVKFDIKPEADGGFSGLVRLIPDISAENAILLGVDYRGLYGSSVSSRMSVSPGIIFRDLTTKDSALFAEASLVNSARAYVEFFQPFGPFHVRPWAKYLLEYDSYDIDDTSFEVDLVYRTMGAGIWTGLSVGRYFDLLAGYGFERVKPGSTVSENLSEAKVLLDFDSRDRLVFTRRGGSALLLGRWASSAIGSEMEMARAEFEGSLHFDLGTILNIGVKAFAGTDFYGLVDGAETVDTSYYFGLRRPGMFYGYKEHSERAEGDHAAALSLTLRARLGRLINLLGGDYYAFFNSSLGAVRVAEGTEIDFFPFRMSYALGLGARISDNLGILGALCLNYDQGASNPLAGAFTVEFGSFSSRLETRR